MDHQKKKNKQMKTKNISFAPQGFCGHMTSKLLKNPLQIKKLKKKKQREMCTGIQEDILSWLLRQWLTLPGSCNQPACCEYLLHSQLLQPQIEH